MALQKVRKFTQESLSFMNAVNSVDFNTKEKKSKRGVNLVLLSK